jgi:tetratricopeptide (TPR) repeat protein
LSAKFYVALAGFSADYHSDRPKSLHFLHKALGLSQTCGDIKSHCAASLGIAHTKWEIGDYAGAMAHATEAQRLGILSGNLYDEAHALQFLAMCSISLGNYSYGLAQLQRAREIIGICGMTGGSLDHSITNLFAEVHLQKSEYAEARNFYSAIIQNTSMDHDIDSYAFTLGNIAGVDIQLGASTQDIHKNLETAKQIFRSIGFEYGRMSCGMIAADLELREGNIISASSLFQASLQWAWGNSSEMVSFCLERLADISRWGGTQLHAPSNWQMVYLGYAKKSEEKLALHKALLLLGDFFLAKSDECTAQSLFTVALEGFTYMDVHQGRAQCMQRLGDLVNKRGDPLKAVDLWMAAQLLFHRSSQAKDVSLIDARLAAAKEAHQRGLTHLTNLSAPAIPPQSLNSKEGESFKIAALVHKPLGEEKAMVSM